jgi:hypothetical protein
VAATFDEFRELVRRARGGDVSALPQLRAALVAHPEVVDHVGDLERVVVRAWAELLGGGDAVSTEAVRQKAEQLRAELEGLLVGQVVAGWLEMSHAQLQAADAGKVTPPHATFRLKRAESAQRRYLAAIKMLTAVRALLPRGLLPANPPRLFEREETKTG